MMAREFQVYQGAAPQAAQVQDVKVPFFGGIPQNGAAVDGAVGQALEAGVRVARLHDLGVQQRVAQERERIRTEMDVEMQQAAELPMGAAESLFRADGSVNQDRYDAIVAKYWGECDKIEPGVFALGENAVRYKGEQEEERNGLALRMMKFAALRSLDNTRKAFSKNLELAVGKEDWGAARKLVEDARGSLLNDTEAEVELLKLQRGQLRAASRSAGYGEPARVNVGGTEYSGLSAALAMERARNGGAATGAPELGVQSAPAGEAVAEGAAAVEEAVPMSAAGDAAVEEAVPMSEAGAWDAGRALALMPQGEFDEVVDAFSAANRVLTLPRADGGVEVSCAPEAPVCVQRAAAVGNACGGVDAQQARMMVARISLDAVADNPRITDSEVVAMFDKAGVYEALGDGDAAVGKERCRAIAVEFLSRAGADANKLNVGAIKPMLSAHLASREFAESREWGMVKSIYRRIGEVKDWDKSKLDDKSALGKEDRKRWFALYDVYRKYRKEFKPDADGGLEKEEFEENASAFCEWYMKEKYADVKKADSDAAADWYMMRVASDLRDKAYVDAEGHAGYAGYGHDVQVARAVLRELPPSRLGADELAAASVEAQKRDAGRSRAFRDKAKDDYKLLHGLRRDVAEHGQKAQREGERRAKAEERKADAEARAAEKRAERVEARKLFVARSMPQEAVWTWDGKAAGDGAMPQCLVPEGEYRRLQEELGFDGSQLVYVQVNGARVLVTGVSKSGRLELNAPAVAKVQKRPNLRRGERWRTDGKLEYSYYFKAAEAK